MPAEAVVVEQGPEEAEAEGADGDDLGEDAAAHGGAGGVFVGEGAETDAGVAHAGGLVGEGEEEGLVDEPEDGQGGDGGERERDSYRDGAGEPGEGGDEGQEAGEDEDTIDRGRHEAQVDGGGERREQGWEDVGRGDVEVVERLGHGVGVEADAAPLGGSGDLDGGVGDLVGFDLEDAELRAAWGVIAEGTFGDAGAGLPGGDELAGELEEVGRQRDGGFDAVLLEDGRVAEGDLVFERAGLFGVADGAEGVASGLAGDDDRGASDVFVEPNGEPGGGDLADGRGWGGRRLDGGLDRGFGGELLGCDPELEFGEEILLDGGGGFGLACGDLGGGGGALEGTFCLFGEEGAVAGGLGVAFCDLGGDAILGALLRRCALVGRGLACAGAPFTMGGEAFRDLLLEGRGTRLVGGLFERQNIELCGAHHGQIQPTSVKSFSLSLCCPKVATSKSRARFELAYPASGAIRYVDSAGSRPACPAVTSS